MKFLAITLFWFPMFADAHSRLLSPTPRSTNPGIKAGPCGGFPRGATPAVWTVGTTVTIRWEETIQHPGKYLFAISPANDTGFVQVASVPDNQNNNTLPHPFKTSLTIPNTPCEACTLQMIQSMEEDPNNPSFYFSCADIKIVAATTTTTTLPEATPTPCTGVCTSSGEGSPVQKPQMNGGCSAGLISTGGFSAESLLSLLPLGLFARLRRRRR